MSDIKRILEKLDGMNKAAKKSTGPKFPGYWKGTDPASKSRSKMVGSAEESIIPELNKLAEQKSVEWRLAEALKAFEEENPNIDPETRQRALDWAKAQNQPSTGQTQPAATTTQPAKPATPATTTAAAPKPGSWQDLARLNPNIKDPNLIYPGQKITLPDTTSAVVDKGDTLSGIAQRYQQGGYSAGTEVDAPAAPATAPAAVAPKPAPAAAAAPKTAPTAGAAAAQAQKPTTQTTAPTAAQGTKPAPGTTAATTSTTVVNPNAPPGSRESLRQPDGTYRVSVVGTGNDVDKANSLISKAESGGDPNVSFGDVYDPKTGTYVNRAKNKFGKPIKLVTPEQFSGGKKLSDMTVAEVMAFQAARNKQQPGSGSVGQYGFMPGTLKSQVAQLGIDPNTRFDANTQRLIQNNLYKQNAATLAKNNIPVTPLNMAMAQAVGAAGTTDVYRAINANPNASVADVLAKAAVARNPRTTYQREYDKLTNLNPHLGTTAAKNYPAYINWATSGRPANKKPVKESDDVYEQFQQMLESEKDKIAGRYDPAEFDAKVKRVGQQAKKGELKTVWDPETRRYKLVPVKQKVDEYDNAQDPNAQTTSPPDPKSSIGSQMSQQQALDKAEIEQNIDVATAKSTASSLANVLGPKVDQNKIASGVTKISDAKPLNPDEQMAVSQLTPLVAKAAETPQTASTLKTVLSQAAMLAKKGK